MVQILRSKMSDQIYEEQYTESEKWNAINDTSNVEYIARSIICMTSK